MALEHGIGCIVVDNFHELELLKTICEKSENIMLFYSG